MSPERHSRRWKLAGWVVLVLGLVAAAIVYWLGTRSADLTDNPEMSRYYKNEAHQMGLIYGKQGLLMDDLNNSLKRPGTQAFLIVAGSVVVALGCFAFARFPAVEDESPGDKTPPAAK
ncbi:MAG: hypothetical protein P4N60_16660 [Verrucomicrobiae bacterium]|nr:hypothetical protein [Verrucomicrobiae bacterium]